jgi:hypothetical protein
MKTIKVLIERHPVLSYFALTFAIIMGRLPHRGRPWRNPGH